MCLPQIAPTRGELYVVVGEFCSTVWQPLLTQSMIMGARVVYANWVDGVKQRGEIAPGVSTSVAAAFLDTQCTSLLMQMALGEEPELVRAQAWLAFAGLTGKGGDLPVRA